MTVSSNQQATDPTDVLYGPSVGDFWQLLKPRVMSLVIFTGFAGMFVAPGGMHPMLFCISLFAIAAGAGASGAINQWYDRDIDAVMARTRLRPVPSGAVEPSEALSFGIIVSVLSVLLLGLASNWFAAGLLAFTIFFYGVVYTVWLKRSTPQNIVIGGAAGALEQLVCFGMDDADDVLMMLLVSDGDPTRHARNSLCARGLTATGAACATHPTLDQTTVVIVAEAWADGLFDPA